MAESIALSSLEREAFLALAVAENQLKAQVEALKKRRAAAFADFLTLHGLPPGTPTNVNLKDGLVTYQEPEPTEEASTP